VYSIEADGNKMSNQKLTVDMSRKAFAGVRIPVYGKVKDRKMVAMPVLDYVLP